MQAIPVIYDERHDTQHRQSSRLRSEFLLDEIDSALEGQSWREGQSPYLSGRRLVLFTPVAGVFIRKSAFKAEENFMKKIVSIVGMALAVWLVAMAAEERENAKTSAKDKSSASVTTEQHVVVTPADLEWADAPPGYGNRGGGPGGEC